VILQVISALFYVFIMLLLQKLEELRRFKLDRDFCTLWCIY